MACCRRGPIVALALLGCTAQVDTGVVASTTAADTTSTTSTGSTSATVTSTTTATSETTSATTESSGVTSEETGVDTEGLERGPCEAGQKVCAIVELDGMPAGFCGQPFEIKGITQQVEPGVWELQDCGACELCGGPTYTVEFVAPGEWDPGLLPLCARLVIDFAPMDVTPWACAFTGMGIWGDDGQGENPAPVYVASSIVTDAPSDVEGLVVTKDNLAPELCEQSGCCYVEPGDYQFVFSGAGLGMPIELAEKQFQSANVYGLDYELLNERSHAHKECDKIPHFDWIMKR